MSIMQMFLGTGGTSFDGYVATGGTITTVGDYKVHSFLSSGTFQVTYVGTSAGATLIEWLVIAGGGGGGGGYQSGGGGAGGYRRSISISGETVVVVLVLKLVVLRLFSLTQLQ